MQKKLTSEGKCYFCGKIFTKAGINRHIKTHLDGNPLKNMAGTSFLIKVEPDNRYGGYPFFLSLWVDGEATMGQLDQFLRNIWLECCGHMSAFRKPMERSRIGMWDFFEVEQLLKTGKIKEYEKLMEDTDGEIPMSRKAKNVFQSESQLHYEYDFGSSTELLISCLHTYPFKAKEPIVLLSRNEPLNILCDSCGKQASTQICTIHNYDENSMFCDACAKKHAKSCSDFLDYARLPRVNSPRAGVCAYEGGTIDIERDR